MKPMNKNIRVTTALTFGMAILSIPILASAQPISVVVQDPATLVARGAGATVSVAVECAEETTFTDLFVRLVQRVGSSIAAGSGSVNSFPCSTEPTIIEVLVTANQSNRAFRKGTAAAEAFLFGCGPFECRQINDARTIRLNK